MSERGPIRKLLCPCGRGTSITGSEQALRNLVRQYRGVACAHCARVMIAPESEPVRFAFSPERERTMH